MEKVLTNVRQHYPTEYVYLASDCSYDFSDVGNRFGCHYVQRSGTPESDGAAKSLQASSTPIKSHLGTQQCWDCSNVALKICIWLFF